jgi:hypothetical protein
VKTMIWDATTGDHFIPSTGYLQSYTGVAVRPHPDFQILLDPTGRVESSRADLALILLEPPVREPYLPLPLAEEDVQPGETFILVGGTADEYQGNSFGARRFMRYKILNFLTPGSDRVLFEQPKRELFRGDSGGPCVLEGPQGPRLVGISSRGLGTEPAFTSLHSYRSWLRAELHSAKPK